MIRGLLAKKLGMTQIFDKQGNVIPVTVLEAGPCVVLGLNEKPLKVKLGFVRVKESRVNQPQLGFFRKIGLPPMRVVREFKSSDNKDYQVGQEIKVDLFKPGDFVDVRGVSIGKGFQGGMKRWNWSGGPGGHGSMHHRRIGSVGSSSDPSRTFRGHHMPGRMGACRVTIQGLRVMQVDSDNNLLVIVGAVPGYNNSIISVNRSQKKAYQSLDVKAATHAKKRNPMKQAKAKAKGKI
jgi:large subunit ribosomal protein L3